MSDDGHSAWYVFVPGIGYARRWQGKELPRPPGKDPGKQKLGAFLEDYAYHVGGEIAKMGAVPFTSLYCGGPWAHVFLIPKTPSHFKAITEKKTQLENLEQTVREWSPERYQEVAAEWPRFRPAGHLLAMEARCVCLPGEEAEMRAEAGEIFRDAYGDIATKSESSALSEWRSRFPADYPRDIAAQPQLATVREAAAADPDRWYVIIGSLKLAGLEGFRCADTDALNSWYEQAQPDAAEQPDRQRAQVLLEIGVSGTGSTGAWFDLEHVRAQTGEGGPPRFTVARLGSHLNFLWCAVSLGIKGPYFLPRVKGIVSRLSEGRRSYREAVARKAKEHGVDVRSLMLFLEVKSPWLGQQGSKEPERLRQWFANAKRGISLLYELYWEAAWTGNSPLAFVYQPEHPPPWASDGHWLKKDPAKEGRQDTQ